MHIPKIIYQTWKDDQVPLHFKQYVETWKKNHPDYKFQLWTDDMNERFILENYPDFLPTYKSYPHNIQRVDAIRYFLLYHFGGIYVDLDIESIKSITPLIENLECFFGTENNVHNDIYDLPVIVSNAFMGCTKGHYFFEKIIEELFANGIDLEDQNRLVLESTGPLMLNRVLDRYVGKDVSLIDYKFVSPLSYMEAEEYINKGSEDFSLKTSSAFCIHLHWGTWWKEEEQVRNI